MISRLKDYIEIYNIVEVLYWLGLSLLLFSEAFSEMGFGNIFTGGVSIKAGVICLVVKLALDGECNKNNQYLMIQCLALFSGIMTYIKTGYIEYFLVFLVVVASRSIDYRQIKTFFMISLTLMFIINIVLIVIGIKGGGTMVDENAGHYGQVRYFLGFGHPNRAFEMFVNIVMSMCLLIGKRLRNTIICFLAAITIILYYLTKGRCGLISMVTLLLMIVIQDTEIAKCLHNKGIIIKASVAIPISMIALGIIYNGEYIFDMHLINTWVTRIVAWGRYYRQYGISLWGTTVDISFPLDCGFFKAIFCSGICGFLSILTLYFISCKRNRKSYAYCISFLVMMLVLTISHRNTMISYALLVIGAFASSAEDVYDTNNSSIELIGIRTLYRSLNVAIIGLIAVILLGHDIVALILENYKLISGDTTHYMRIIDCLLSVVGVGLGYFVFRKLNEKSAAVKNEEK